MGVFDGCLLACDIDGTLVINGKIPERNKEAINFFIKEGGHFSIATGRSVAAFRNILDELGNIAPCIVTNGCIIYDYNQCKILHEEALSINDYKIAKEINNTDKNIGIEIHSGETVIGYSQTQESIDHQVYEGLNALEIDFDEASKYIWNKVLFLLDNKEDLEFIIDFVKAFEFECDFIETTATIDNRKRLYFEMIPRNINKATGLSKLAEILKINRGCVYAIGDYYNDLEMIKKADIGAAVADSPDDIKLQADFVAGKCDDGAVADFINYLFNKRKDANDGFSN